MQNPYTKQKSTHTNCNINAARDQCTFIAYIRAPISSMLFQQLIWFESKCTTFISNTSLQTELMNFVKMFA